MDSFHTYLAQLHLEVYCRHL